MKTSMLEAVDQTVQEAPPPGYRMTELGLLPEDWRVVKLGDVFDLRRETVQPQDMPDMPYVGLEHLLSGNTRIFSYGESGEVRSAKSLFRPGDILYGKLRPYLDKAALAEFTGMASTDILILVPRNGLCPEYASYLVHTRSFLAHATATTAGVNHPRTSWSALRELRVALPPLPEQRAIAHVLSTVQRARERTDAVIAATRELKRSLMRHLFTYGPVPVGEIGRVKLKETEIGLVPEEWEVAALGSLLRTGPQNGLYKPQERYGEGVPIVRINDFGNDGETIHTAEHRVVVEPEEFLKYQLSTGDILINRVNSLSHLGKLALVGPLDVPLIFESNMMRFNVDPNRLYPAYAFRLLTSGPVREQLRSKAKRAVAQSSINQGDVTSTSVPYPKLSEQLRIAHQLQACESKERSEQHIRQSLASLFDGLLDAVLRGSDRAYTELLDA